MNIINSIIFYFIEDNDAGSSSSSSYSSQPSPDLIRNSN